jgi:phosphate uptake regulator
MYIYMCVYSVKNKTIDQLHELIRFLRGEKDELLIELERAKQQVCDIYTHIRTYIINTAHFFSLPSILLTYVCVSLLLVFVYNNF